MDAEKQAAAMKGGPIRNEEAADTEDDAEADKTVGAEDRSREVVYEDGMIKAMVCKSPL